MQIFIPLPEGMPKGGETASRNDNRLVKTKEMETTKHFFHRMPRLSSCENWFQLGGMFEIILEILKLGVSSWGDSANLISFLKGCFDIVIQTTFWILRRFRYRVCFVAKPPRKDTLGEEIKLFSHSLILHRYKKANPTWFEWICNPNHACTISL